MCCPQNLYGTLQLIFWILFFCYTYLNNSVYNRVPIIYNFGPYLKVRNRTQLVLDCNWGNLRILENLWISKERASWYFCINKLDICSFLWVIKNDLVFFELWIKFESDNSVLLIPISNLGFNLNKYANLAGEESKIF